MLAEITPENMPINQNTDILDFIDKSWAKASQGTKEQKEKVINEIFYDYIIKISSYIKDHNGVALTDLILDKSLTISELTDCYEWPKAESLKASNLEPASVTLYNYAKVRLMLLYSKNTKQGRFCYFRSDKY